MNPLKLFTSLFLLLAVCLLLTPLLTSAEFGGADEVIDLDFSLPRFLEARENTSTNGSCVPNEAKNGIVCTHVLLYQSSILNWPLSVWLNLNTTFNYPTNNIFWTQVWIYVTFKNFTDQLWAEFEFNSTTPNNTELAWGTRKIGQFRLKTGNSAVPVVPVVVEATHNVTLWVDPCPDQSANYSWCDSGTIRAVVAVQANGYRGWNGGSHATVKLEAPDAVTVTAPYHFSVNRTWSCAQLAEEIVYDKHLLLQVDVCPAAAPCHKLNHEFNATTWDVNKTIVDECFAHEIPFPVA